MKRVAFFLLLFFTAQVAIGQDNDINSFYSDIKELVTDSTSQYFYPSLLKKVKNSPEKIDVMDCYYLYYGKLFQPNHKWVSFMDYPERRDFDIAAAKSNCGKVIQLGKIMLQRNPVYLTALLHTAICIDKQNNYIDKDFFPQRYHNLLTAILITGDGKTKETAIKIVDIEDDYIIKGALHFLGGTEEIYTENSRAYSIWTKGKEKLYFEDLLNYNDIQNINSQDE